MKYYTIAANTVVDLASKLEDKHNEAYEDGKFFEVVYITENAIAYHALVREDSPFKLPQFFND